MAGYILKIVMEKTYPPVWRRVIIPDKIAFTDLHHVIQLLFGWDGMHLHDFSIPSKKICITMGEGYGNYVFPEDTTLVDDFLQHNKWILYTYDFGDDWKHKIICEKTDENYHDRHVTLLKVNGDNFQEDCGGIYIYNEATDRYPINEQQLQSKFSSWILTKSEINQSYMEDILKEEQTKASIAKAMKQMINKMQDKFEAETIPKKKKKFKDISPMTHKINQWKELTANQKKIAIVVGMQPTYQQITMPFLEEDPVIPMSSKMMLRQSTKSIKDCLMDLNIQEASDYCKYLQLSVAQKFTQIEKVQAIAEDFTKHPEHLTYVLYEKEWNEIVNLLKKLNNGTEFIMKPSIAIIKAMKLGLLDFTWNKKEQILSIASDAPDLLNQIRGQNKTRLYNKLQEVSKYFHNFMAAYGMLEIKEFYRLFSVTHSMKLSESEFRRYVYWYAKFNNLVHVMTMSDGKQYVIDPQLDAQAIINDSTEYDSKLTYAEYDAHKLEETSSVLWNPWSNLLYKFFLDYLEFPGYDAITYVNATVMHIKNGQRLDVLMEQLEVSVGKQNLDILIELWLIISGMMLNIELPMLKGHTRISAAAVQNTSAWTLKMLSEKDNIDYGDNKEIPIYKFPDEIQEKMFETVEYCNEQTMVELNEYMKRERIQSEQYQLLLANAYITNTQFDKAYEITKILKQGSPEAAKEAKFLEIEMEEDADILMEEDDT